MKLTTLLGLCLCAPICLAQTTVTPIVTGQSVTLQFTGNDGGTYTVTLPYLVTPNVGPLAVDGRMIAIPFSEAAAFSSATVNYVAPLPPNPPPVSGAPTIPSSAIAVDLINPKTAWKNTKDAGTPGTATFSNTYPSSNIFFDDAGKSIDARVFSIAYQNGAGVRFSNNFAKDTAATHFVYDTVVQSPDWTHAANLELDINQVKANGQTAILGTQCSVYSHTWEVTLNKTGNTGWHWVPTNVFCDTTKWTPNTPHHIRIFGTIDAAGVATYEGVEYDGKYSAFTGATGLTARPLGWSVGSVLPNFQIDGLGASGTATIYADRLTIYRW